MNITRFVLLASIALFISAVTNAQQPSPSAALAKLDCRGDAALSMYRLGPGDELQLSGAELDEPADNLSPVDGDGLLQVPLLGRVHVGGLTVKQAEDELDKQLSTYIRKPEVAITVKEWRSQPVSVLGAVNSPGVHQVQGNQTLLEELSLAGGLRTDAGYSVHITRGAEWGCIPLSSAHMDASEKFYVASVDLKDIMEAKNPEENIQIFPHDVISVSQAEMVYVIGDVKRSGGFVLGEHASISVLQALSLAEGLGPSSRAQDSTILRVNPGTGERTEIPINLKAILSGKKQDVALQSNDILFVPDSVGKKAFSSIVQATVSTAIWHIP